MIPFETVATGASPTADSLVIPYSALYGITDDTEFSGSQAESDGKISSAVFLTMADKLSNLSSPFGVSFAKGNPTGAGDDIIRQNVAITWNYVADFSNSEVSTFPVSSGNSAELAFTDVFTGAEVLETTGSATSDSIAIALSDIQGFNSNATVANLQGNLGSEQRDLLETVTRMVHTLSEARNNGTASAVQAKSRSNANGSSTPSNFFSNTEFSESDEPKLAFFTINYSMTHEYLLDQDSQEFDVRVST